MNILFFQNRGKSVTRGGLTALYDFRAGTGQTLADQSGAGRNSTLGSTSGVDTSDPTWSSSGLVFDGVDDFVAVPTIVLGGEQTVIVVGSTTTIAGTVAIYGSGAAATYMGIRGGTGALLNTLNDSVSQKTIDQGVIAINTPFMATRRVSQTGQYMDSHLNTVKSTSVATVGAHTATAVNALYVGRAGFGGFWPGTIHYVALYNRILTDAEVQTAYKTLKRTLIARGVALP